jgi:hypothetical protein
MWVRRIKGMKAQETLYVNEFTNGILDPEQEMLVPVKDGGFYMKTPDNSIHNPVVTFAPHDLVGTVARLRPFLGQLGCYGNLVLNLLIEIFPILRQNI